MPVHIHMVPLIILVLMEVLLELLAIYQVMMQWLSACIQTWGSTAPSGASDAYDGSTSYTVPTGSTGARGASAASVIELVVYVSFHIFYMCLASFTGHTSDTGSTVSTGYTGASGDCGYSDYVVIDLVLMQSCTRSAGALRVFYKLYIHIEVKKHKCHINV